MTKLYPRGSEWRKWDLHIHSTASDGHATPREILEEARKKGLSVIALTDHHCTDNIDEIKKIAEEEFKDITVISGIEFRSEYGGSSVHFIGLFPDKFSRTNLNSRALNDLILSPLGISRTAIIAKGLEGNPDLKEEEAFKNGLCKVQVDLKKAATLIHQYGGIVTIHHGSKRNGLDKEVKHFGKGDQNVHDLYDSLGQLKDELLNKYVDICEISKAGDNSKWYLEKYGKTSIIASDAHRKEGIHNENTHENGIGDRFTWIKADPTFEGLKQIIYEPAERVRIQDHLPEEKRGYEVIDRITLSGNDFYNQEIPLNQNLVTIIGGRSSGKSTLLEGIVRTINPNIIINLKQNDKDNIDNNKEEFFSEICKGISITWKDNNDNSIIRDVDYFPQENMYEIARDSKKSDGLISKILLENDEYKAFIKETSEFEEQNKTNLLLTCNTLQSYLNKKKESQKPEADKVGIENEILKLKRELEVIRTNGISFTDEEQKQYNNIQDEIKNANTVIISIDGNISLIEDIVNEDIISQIIIDKVSRLNPSVANNAKQTIENKFTQIRDEFKVFLDEEIKLLQEEKQKQENNIIQKKNSDIYIKGNKVLQENSRYNEIYNKLKVEEERLSNFKKWEEEQNQLSLNINQYKQKLIDEHLLYSSNLQIKNYPIKDDIEIKVIPYLHSNEMVDYFWYRLNKQGYEKKEYIETFAQKYKDDQRVKLEDFIDKCINNQIECIDGNNPYDVLQNFITKNWYSYSYDIIYQNDKFADMSPGKKAYIILRLLLDHSKKTCPILIDQPEDSLDNRAIYTELVQYLKQKKIERQIILVTHNPNIVIGTDAEQVIVANQNGINSCNDNNVKFQYISGALENTIPKNPKEPIILKSQGIREHICEILEGGEDAFEKREKKYGFSRT